MENRSSLMPKRPSERRGKVYWLAERTGPGVKWAWNCLVVGLGVWFVLDTGISWQYGVTFNVFFNIVVALATGVPLVFTLKAFVG